MRVFLIGVGCFLYCGVDVNASIGFVIAVSASVDVEIRLLLQVGELHSGDMSEGSTSASGTPPRYILIETFSSGFGGRSCERTTVSWTRRTS
ncbi:hypothetical protein C8J56DRAFT_981533 [Mycena floridula]|nr:hypothetical protein C8J56DRAFT_981533 [Mycena floridula]